MTSYPKRIKHENFIGTKVGEVRVIEFSHFKEKKDRFEYYYKYECSCGEIGIAPKSSLQHSLRVQKENQRETYCCEQCRKRRLSEISAVRSIRYSNPEDAHIATVFSNYKSRAKLKKLDVDLDFNEFKFLVKQNCYFCGQSPQNIRKDHTKKRIGISRGKLNGLDRIDSTKGYLKNNVVPCCEDCNKAKRNLDIKDFLILVKNIYKNLNLGNNIEGNPFKYTIEAFGH